VLLAVAGCSQNRSLGDRIDDSAAGLTLKGELLFTRGVDTSDVDMTVFEGRLLLAGTVRSEGDKILVEDKAASIAEVEEVINELQVLPKTTVSQGTKDALIDQRLSAALLADTGIAAGNYRILVSQGTVYLLGVAAGPNELRRAVGQAQAIDGVNEVVSHVIYLRDPRRTGSR
ncbi:MAG: BON domain-containing protein, partial [Parvularcula sp.]|nr:BON domain-containing protein [Parvularcula sp.]